MGVISRKSFLSYICNSKEKERMKGKVTRNISNHAAGVQSLSNPTAQGVFKGNDALNGLVDLGPIPLTVPLSITVAADSDPADPKDLIVPILSGVTWAEGGDPIVGSDIDGGSSKG